MKISFYWCWLRSMLNCVDKAPQIPVCTWTASPTDHISQLPTFLQQGQLLGVLSKPHPGVWARSSASSLMPGPTSRCMDCCVLNTGMPLQQLRYLALAFSQSVSWEGWNHIQNIWVLSLIESIGQKKNVFIWLMALERLQWVCLICLGSCSILEGYSDFLWF